MTEKKRRLSEFNFTKEGSHIALCSDTLNGGAANGYKTLIYKANGLGDSSDEAIDILKNVQVTLPFNEFLRKFFDMWWDDAEVLARALGFTGDDIDSGGDEWIENRVAQISIIKNAKDSEDTTKFINELDIGKENFADVAALIKFQKENESTLLESDSHEPSSKADEDKEGIRKDSKTKNNPEDNSMDEVKIEKSELEEIKKSAKEAKTLKAELEEIKKAKEDEDKKQVAELVKSYSFVKEGEEADALVTTLHKARDIEGASQILSILTKAQAAIDEFVEKEDGVEVDTVITDSESYQDAVVKNLKAIK